MNFHDRLVTQTQQARDDFQAIPLLQQSLAGQVSLPLYQAFLTEAYHHVRHTVPLLHATRAALGPSQRWMDDALDEYIAEEQGHEQWILDDLAASGADAESARTRAPSYATELMVAYAYDTIARVNPLGFLGMVHVLEGSSVALALHAAAAIQKNLRLPDSAFTYLRSHGELDQSHTAHFANLVNLIEPEVDQKAIVHAARMFYRLYGDIFRELQHRPGLSLRALGVAA
ncbi:MAG: hypothetical protein RI906_3834 [Pseudomonadota bacterium]|jgi:pyrroloquinoline quinone (PQQ) biosynthesis protein C